MPHKLRAKTKIDSSLFADVAHAGIHYSVGVTKKDRKDYFFNKEPNMPRTNWRPSWLPIARKPLFIMASNID